MDRTRAHGETVLAQVLSGGGGVGKSQLAVACLEQARMDGVEFTLWATGDEQQAIEAFARAAHNVRAPGATGASEDIEADARIFLNWLGTTTRTWMVVLDDVTDFEAMAPWWPPSRPGSGWTLATTRQRGAHVTGQRRRVVDVGVFEHDETITYFHQRLAEDAMQRLLDGSENEIATELGRLPLALGYAAAYLINEEISASEYLVELRDQALHLAEVLPPHSEGYTADDARPRNIAAALLLSLNAATRRHRDGTHQHRGGQWAEALLQLISVLSPDGQPHDLWCTEAVRTHLSSCPGQLTTRRPNSRDVRHALRLLHTYGLITHQRDQPHRAVRIHALTARATRDFTPETRRGGIARTAADAIRLVNDATAGWDRDLSGAITANIQALRRSAGAHLWLPSGPHHVLFLHGAILHSQGQFSMACEVRERVAADSDARYGSDHPETLAARGNLATTYQALGRDVEALDIREEILPAFERLNGAQSPSTIVARANLAASYQSAGRYDEAHRLKRQVLADRECTVGTQHLETVRARANLAQTLVALGRYQEALELEEQALADRERLLGPHHPDTITSRSNLAATYSGLGRHQEALQFEEQALADRERVLGASHPTTLRSRANVASKYYALGQYEDACRAAEHALADYVRVLGSEHHETLTARSNLGVIYQKVGRSEDALVLDEEVLGARERTLGQHHPSTLLSRVNLSSAHYELGRYEDALRLAMPALSSFENALGRRHPRTAIVRANVVIILRALGREEEARGFQEDSPPSSPGVV
ncbi:tetratricopeptide repeat protein [Streptomyces sp. NPDC048330]|uniref:tetratricopeptide repeat protein n=1 Tax=Streptomyces sp. NPDC048330 TaxID=3365533 RepID=UPI003722E662